MAHLIIDAHLDLSMNAMEWNRDLRKPILEIRQREKILPINPIAVMVWLALKNSVKEISDW